MYKGLRAKSYVLLNYNKAMCKNQVILGLPLVLKTTKPALDKEIISIYQS